MGTEAGLEKGGSLDDMAAFACGAEEAADPFARPESTNAQQGADSGTVQHQAPQTELPGPSSSSSKAVGGSFDERASALRGQLAGLTSKLRQAHAYVADPSTLLAEALAEHRAIRQLIAEGLASGQSASSSSTVAAAAPAAPPAGAAEAAEKAAAAASEQSSELQQQLEAALEQLAAAQQALSEREAALQESSAASVAEAAALAAKLQALQQQLASKEQQLSQLQQQPEAAAATEAAQAAAEAESKQAAELQQQLQAAQQQLSAAQGVLAETEASLQQSCEQREATEAEAATLSNELQALQEQLLEKDEQLTHLQQQQVASSDHTPNGRGALGGNSQWLQEAQQELMAVQDDLVAREAEVRELKKQLAAAQAAALAASSAAATSAASSAATSAASTQQQQQQQPSGSEQGAAASTAGFLPGDLQLLQQRLMEEGAENRALRTELSDLQHRLDWLVQLVHRAGASADGQGGSSGAVAGLAQPELREDLQALLAMASTLQARYSSSGPRTGSARARSALLMGKQLAGLLDTALAQVHGMRSGGDAAAGAKASTGGSAVGGPAAPCACPGEEQWARLQEEELALSKAAEAAASAAATQQLEREMLAEGLMLTPEQAEAAAAEAAGMAGGDMLGGEGLLGLGDGIAATFMDGHQQQQQQGYQGQAPDLLGDLLGGGSDWGGSVKVSAPADMVGGLEDAWWNVPASSTNELELPDFLIKKD